MFGNIPTKVRKESSDACKLALELYGVTNC